MSTPSLALLLILRGDNSLRPLSSRVAFELIAPSLRHDWLELRLEAGDTIRVKRPVIRIPCDGLCDDVWQYRFVADFAGFDEDDSGFDDGEVMLTLSMRQEEGADVIDLVTGPIASWPALRDRTDLDRLFDSFPFAITAVRTANHFRLNGCQDEADARLCGQASPPPSNTVEDVKCLIVSKCPVDTDEQQDWLVLAGVGLHLLRHPEIRVMAFVKDRYLLQGSETDWIGYDSVLSTVVNRQFGLQLVDLNDDGAIDALADVSNEVKQTLKQLDVANKFGHADVDIDSSTVLLAPVPRGLAEYNLPLGAMAVWKRHKSNALFDVGTYGEVPSTNATAYQCNPCTESVHEFLSYAVPFEGSYYPLVSYNGAFFVQLKQVANPQLDGNCELVGNVVQGCSRLGGNRLQLMAFNLNTTAFHYGVRLVYEDKYTFSSGNVTIGTGLADSQTIEFDLPPVPQ
ncbi:MAG: hypothetical protein MHM6MM_008830 [Cercozoa sp. M6MM]